MSTSSRSQELARLFGAIRAMHQRNRTVANLYGFSWGLAQAHATVEVAVSPGIPLSRLGKRLGLSAVATTRLLKNAERAGLLRWESDPSDRRVRKIRLGPAAGDLLAKNLERNVATFGAAYERLTVQGRRRFHSYLKRLCDAWPAPPACAARQEPPLMEEIRRLTRALGLLNDRLSFAPWCSPLEWHVLNLARDQGEKGTPTSILCSSLAAPSALIDKLLRSLKKQGLVKCSRKTQTNQSHLVFLKEKGRAVLIQLEELGCREFGRCLADFSTEQISEFASLWEDYAGKFISPLTQAITKGSVLQCVSSSVGLAQARRFIAEQRVKQKLLRDLPATIIGPESLVFVLYRLNTPAAAVQFDELRPGEWSATHLVTDSNQVSQRTIAELCPILLQNAFLLSAASRITFKRLNTSRPVWQVLAGKRKNEGSISFVVPS